MNLKTMNSYLRVQAGNHIFAVPVPDVDRVCVPEMITAIPAAPQCIRGAMAIAGSIYVVADLRYLAAGLPAKVDVKSRVVCFVNPVAGAMFSVLVDRVLEIVTVEDDCSASSHQPDQAAWYRKIDGGEIPIFATSAAEIYAATNAACGA